jgi:hypothetical protein
MPEFEHSGTRWVQNLLSQAVTYYAYTGEQVHLGSHHMALETNLRILRLHALLNM